MLDKSDSGGVIMETFSYDDDIVRKFALATMVWVFVANCASCHGIDGGGGIGPNLTDDHWKAVRNIGDIANVIKDGANNVAMPAWGTRFNHPNILVLTNA